MSKIQLWTIHCWGFLCKQRENIIKLFHLFVSKKESLFDSLYSAKTDKKFPVLRGNKQKTRSHQALGENVFSVCFPLIQGIFCLFLQNTKNQTGFLFWIQTDGIILLCFLFVCIGNPSNVWSITKFWTFQLPQTIVTFAKLSKTYLFVN